jgi:hypothetical protein
VAEGDEVAIEGCRNLLSHNLPEVRITALAALGTLKIDNDANRRILLAISMSRELLSMLCCCSL